MTDTIDGKAITAEEFLRQARRWAVSYGQPRVPGKYVNPRPRIRRSMVDWLDEPIDRKAERLFDLAAEFWGDRCLVNFFGTKS